MNETQTDNSFGKRIATFAYYIHLYRLIYKNVIKNANVAQTLSHSRTYALISVWFFNSALAFAWCCAHLNTIKQSMIHFHTEEICTLLCKRVHELRTATAAAIAKKNCAESGFCRSVLMKFFPDRRIRCQKIYKIDINPLDSSGIWWLSLNMESYFWMMHSPMQWMKTVFEFGLVTAAANKGARIQQASQTPEPCVFMFKNPTHRGMEIA